MQPTLDVGFEEDPTQAEPKAKVPAGVERLQSMFDKNDPRGKPRIMPQSFSIESAAMIMNMYAAGLPLCSTILIPMLTALAEARGLQENIKKFAYGQILARWVQRLTQSMGLSLRKAQTDRFKLTADLAEISHILLLPKIRIPKKIRR